MRYKKKKAQLHDTTQLARANHGRRMQRGGGSPRTWTALRHISGDANENLFALPLRNPFHIKFFVDLLSFRLASGYNTMLHKGDRERERVRERDRARENQLAHAGARDLPQSEPSQTQRERDNIPPTQKRSESFCRSLTGVAQAQGLGQGAGQGASRGRPCRDRRTEMGRAQQRTDMQLQLLLWRPGWEL